MAFDQMINPVSFLTVLIIDHRVVEIINMTLAFQVVGCMKMAASIPTMFSYIRVMLFPPVILDIFFQFAAPLAIIIYSLQSIINFTAGKNKTILFACEIIAWNLF